MSECVVGELSFTKHANCADSMQLQYPLNPHSQFVKLLYFQGEVTTLGHSVSVSTVSLSGLRYP